jgi:homogentisate 1,2-dioxygenase
MKKLEPHSASSIEKPRKQSLNYLAGFGNHFQSEAEVGALPVGQNSPQKPPLGLYAEQLSGSAFTNQRHENLRSWLYRIHPSVLHSNFEPVPNGKFLGRPFLNLASPNQMRWNAIDFPDAKTDFLEGIVTIAGNGDFSSVRGCAVHLYAANCDMVDKFFYDAEGEILIVPQEGELHLRTEFGAFNLAPGEIIVVPTGIKFAVDLLAGQARGYILENFGPPFRLPHLGPIGSNGLANARDFLYPHALYEQKEKECELFTKFQGNLYKARLNHSPLDVVAWHGNYAPYKYDLSKFNVINSVSFDHPDPSIFTVLTSPSELPGTANVDFVIFPPQWHVSEHTFRPPFFHRNVMSEAMGLIFGKYAGKEEGFVPGGMSLHNRMSPHGPDAATFDAATNAKLAPQKMENTLAFMFESSLVFQPTEFALKGKHRQANYLSCWNGLTSHFEKPDADL